GSGLHTFYPALQRYQTAGVRFAWPAAHNEYLQLLCELGAIGFVVPAVLMLTVFRSAAAAALRHTSTEGRLLALACVGSLTAMLIHSAADFNLQVPVNAMALCWISGLAVALYRSREAQVAPPTKFVRAVVLLFGCVAVLAASGSVMFNRWFRNE